MGDTGCSNNKKNWLKYHSNLIFEGFKNSNGGHGVQIIKKNWLKYSNLIFEGFKNSDGGHGVQIIKKTDWSTTAI